MMREEITLRNITTDLDLKDGWFYSFTSYIVYWSDGSCEVA